MPRPKDPELERLWRQRLQRQSASGLSIVAFCTREAVSLASFHAWKRRLAAPTIPSRPRPLFVPIRLDATASVLDRVPGPAVQVELPQQVRLHFDAPPDPDWLGRVVLALAAIPRREDAP